LLVVAFVCWLILVDYVTLIVVTVGVVTWLISTVPLVCWFSVDSYVTVDSRCCYVVTRSLPRLVDVLWITRCWLVVHLVIARCVGWLPVTGYVALVTTRWLVPVYHTFTVLPHTVVWLLHVVVTFYVCPLLRYIVTVVPHTYICYRCYVWLRLRIYVCYTRLRLVTLLRWLRLFTLPRLPRCYMVRTFRFTDPVYGYTLRLRYVVTLRLGYLPTLLVYVVVAGVPTVTFTFTRTRLDGTVGWLPHTYTDRLLLRLHPVRLPLRLRTVTLRWIHTLRCCTVTLRLRLHTTVDSRLHVAPVGCLHTRYG